MHPTTPKIALAVALVALINLEAVAAHGHVWGMMIDGNYYDGTNVNYLDPTEVSSMIRGDSSGNNFKTRNSTELATNAPDGTKAKLHAAVSGGSVIQWFWDQWPISHHGPVLEYMARCPDTGCQDFEGNTATNWFKVGEAAYDAAEGVWAADEISLNTAIGWQMTMPTDLESGYYLIRHEIIALHDTQNPQFYPCAFWAYLTSTGSTVPTAVGSFPAMYDSIAPFNVDSGTTDDPTTYPIPGVPLYEASLAGNSGPVANGTAVPTGAYITTDAGPGGAVSAPAASSSVAGTLDASSSAAAAPASSTSASASMASSSVVVGSSSSTLASSSASSVAASAIPTVIASTSSSAAPSTPTTSVSDESDQCDGEDVTITVTVSNAQATATDADVCSDSEVTVTVTASAAAQTSAGSGLAISNSAAAPSSGAGSSAGPGGSGGSGGSASTAVRTQVKGSSATAAATSNGNAASTGNPYWQGSWGSNSVPAALATGTACECPTTRNLIERDDTPLIEEVFTRAGKRFITRGLVFTSSVEARAACGTDCEFLTASKRKVESRWTRAF